MDFYGRDILTLADYSHEEISYILEISQKIKAQVKSGSLEKPLRNKALGMIFQKRSTRTRVSSEVGMFLLGGHALFLGKDDIQLGVNETLKDTALVMSRMVNGILARVYGHQTVEELAKYSSVPVINALSDKYHPLQILADLLTIKEKLQHLKGLKLAWIGDGNNVLHSLLIGCSKMGINISVATPNGYEPKPDVVKIAREESKKTNSRIFLTNSPEEAIEGANIVVTDTFVSMGQEKEAEIRKKAFSGFQVNTKLVQDADQNYIFMHCLPRHQEEVSDDVFYSNHSVVFDEAENRLYTAMAVFQLLMSK